MSRASVQQKNAVISPTDAAVLLHVNRATVRKWIRMYIDRTEDYRGGWLYGFQYGKQLRTTMQAVRAYNNGDSRYEPREVIERRELAEIMRASGISDQGSAVRR